MQRKRVPWTVPVLGAVILSLALGQRQLASALEREAVVAPSFEVDPMWPKPLPNHWILGATIGVAVDAKDNVWIIHRQGSIEEKERYATWTPKASECCVPAPPVLAFNPAGDLISNWGGADGPGPRHGELHQPLHQPHVHRRAHRRSHG
jgi:hypothetical protein